MACWRHAATTVILATVVVTAMPVLAFAERLFAPSATPPSAARGIARVQTLDLDAAALARLRAGAGSVLEEFPLGTDGTATVSVTRFDPFADGARAEVVTSSGPSVLALPDRVYFRGQVDGDDDSLVVIVTGADFARGFVETAGTVYRFGRDQGGSHRSWAVRDADPAAFPAPPALCANDAHPDLVRQPGRTSRAPQSEQSAPRAPRYSPTLMVEVAIETDQELRAKFASNAETLDYLADLAAAVSAIYDADTDVRVVFRYIRLWNTTDPWTESSTGGMLTQVRNYWISNEAGVVRDTVHFVSGKTVNGGVAYLDTLCNPAFAYAVSQVYGEFDLMEPSDVWDVIVFAHELGHNFGSEHTHCYDPPVDNCYNDEPGCYTGDTSLPPGGGTIMSYCHRLSGGLANINLTFGTTVSDVLRAGADGAMCIGLPCGDGTLDPGEECDDGNIVDGDCCSSTCIATLDGEPCDDQEACTETDVCTGGTCAGTPLDGPACDDGTACTVDTCQAGVCVGVATPSVGCKLPTVPGKAQLTFKDKTPDSRDLASWKWTKGDATDLVDFGDPTATEDYELCIYDGASALVFAARVPAGGLCGGVSCWKATGTTGFAYKDKELSPDGIQKLKLKAGTAGAAKVQAKGKGDSLPMPSVPLDLPVRVQLENSTACWEANYSTALKNEPGLFKAKSD